MYNHHNQGHSNLLSSRSTFPQERHLFLLGGSITGESGLVLSTDAKPRLKWTSELHERFIEAVNQLGGADKATPKTVMRLMGIPGLTLYHLKSHLQKYRLSKNLQAQATGGGTKSGCVPAAEKLSETNGPFITNCTSIMPQTNKTMQINEALQMQIEVQRRLHEQLEVQRHLQLRIEAQGKYLQSVLEKAQETLGKQNLGSSGLEAAKLQLSELVSKVSNECFRTAFSTAEDFPAMNCLQVCPSQHADCSVDSCLTSSEGSQKEQDIYNRRFINSCRKYLDDNKLDEAQAVWFGDLNEQKVFTSSILRDAERPSCTIQLGPNIMPMNVKAEKQRETVSEYRRKERSEDILLEQPDSKRHAVQQAKRVNQPNIFGMPCPSTKLDLNAREDNEVALECKQFDLNGFSWS